LVWFVEKDGLSTVFVLTDAAAKQFRECECWRIYEMQIAGKCVRINNTTTKYGVKHTQEVSLKFPCTLELSKQAWPVNIQYELLSWDSLNQQEPDTFVDPHGKVFGKPILDASSTLRKLVVTLANGNLKQDVAFLGEHASLALKIGDVVVLGGARIQKYREQRSIQTAYLTIVEINPASRGNIRFDISTEEGSKT
jgi:hypothetical protein